MHPCQRRREKPAAGRIGRRAISPRWSAFTIMELMIVLALLVLIAAISIPVIQSTMDDSYISATGDQVRGLMAEARARATDETIPYKLAVLPNTGVYQLAPEESSDWEQVQTGLSDKPEVLRDELPHGLVFAASHNDIMGKAEAQAAGTGWQTVAVFLPDGSARDDTVIYFGKPGVAPMRAKLRALTGTVTIEQFNTTMAGEQP